MGGIRDITLTQRKGIPVWGMWYPFRAETERDIRIHPPNKARDEGKAAAREHGVEVRVGDRRRPARVSDVSNPNKRHILPMNLGKEDMKETTRYSDAQCEIFRLRSVIGGARRRGTKGIELHVVFLSSKQ